jgi:CO/xanthine dehydrogenase FAD-binding subunit
MAPATTAQALEILRDRGADAKVLAGGQSLVPLLNFRLARPQVIVDLNRIPGLDSIAEDVLTSEIVLGALVRQADAERSPIVRRRCPLLAEALGRIGHSAVRNRGTIGGSIAHADPAAELPLVLVALGGHAKIASTTGERDVGANELFVTYLTTSIAPDELLVEARFPFMPPGTGWGFEEFSRRSGDFALAAACAVVTLSRGLVDRCALAIAGGGPTPVRAEAAERLLQSTTPNPITIAAAATAAADACDVDADVHASADYRRALIHTLAGRALASAIARARVARP